MSKKILAYLFVFAVLATSAYAQIGNVAGSIMNALRPILFMGTLSGLEFTFWAKFMIWILLFAVLYAVSGMIPFLADKEHKNIRTTVAFIIALISTTFMPASILTAIFQSYGIVATVFIIGLPTVGLVYGIHKAFPQPTRFHYGMKALAYYLLAVIVSNFLNVSGTQVTFIPTLRNIAQFIIGIAIIMTIVYAFLALTGGAGGAIGGWFGGLFGGGGHPPAGGAPPAGGPGGGGAGPGGGGGHGGPGGGGAPHVAHLHEYLHEIEGFMHDFESTLEDLEHLLNNILAANHAHITAGAPPVDADLWNQLNELTIHLHNLGNDINSRFHWFLTDPNTAHLEEHVIDEFVDKALEWEGLTGQHVDLMDNFEAAFTAGEDSM